MDADNQSPEISISSPKPGTWPFAFADCAAYLERECGRDRATARSHAYLCCVSLWMTANIPDALGARV